MFPEISQNRRYGYVRISSKSQESNSSIDSQKQELIQNGILDLLQIPFKTDLSFRI